MRSLIVVPVLALVLTSFVNADISLPLQDTFYDKAGRGIANMVLAPTEIADSFFTLLQTDGPTVAISKGLVQGTGRAVSDMALGAFDVITAPFPIGPGASYRTFKSPAHGSMVVDEYPPADLIRNWY